MSAKWTRLKRSRWFSISVVIVLIIGILSAAVLLQYSIDDTAAVSTGYDESTPFESARSFMDILGGIRETLAAYMWTKTDVLFHDYLGGDLLNEDIIFPYYYLITRLDKHFAMAFYFASWMLCRFDRVDDGFNLALEGLRYNPNSALLQQNLAQIYLFYKNDPKKARYHTLQAMNLTDDEGDLVTYEVFLGLVDKVLSGERTIPEAQTLEEMREAVDAERLLETEEEHHGHDHEHDHNDGQEHEEDHDDEHDH